MDNQHKILKPGQVIIECGAAPGAWTQVAVSRVNSLPKGNVSLNENIQFENPVKYSLVNPTALDLCPVPISFL